MVITKSRTRMTLNRQSVYASLPVEAPHSHGAAELNGISIAFQITPVFGRFLSTWGRLGRRPLCFFYLYGGHPRCCCNRTGPIYAEI